MCPPASACSAIGMRASDTTDNPAIHIKHDTSPGVLAFVNTIGRGCSRLKVVLVLEFQVPRVLT